MMFSIIYPVVGIIYCRLFYIYLGQQLKEAGIYDTDNAQLVLSLYVYLMIMLPISAILPCLGLIIIPMYGYIGYMQMDLLYAGSRNINHILPFIFVFIQLGFTSSGVRNYGLYLVLTGMKMTMKEVAAEE
jgi:hypothetical protein